eukprot:2893768-Amphidinium_carterae.1
MGEKKRRMVRQAAAKARAQSREMSLPRVAENDVMEMDVSSPSDVAGVSYASVTSGAASASSGTGWSWQASGSAAASSGAASSGWTDWQAD